MRQVRKFKKIKKNLLFLCLVSLLNSVSIVTFADSSSSNSSSPTNPASTINSNSNLNSNPIDACSPLYGPGDFSHKNITLNGPTHCANGDSNVSVINGPISATNTHFNNPVVINGPIHTDHVIFDQAVVINGPGDLINTTFSKSLTIRGPIHAQSSNFTGDVDIWSDTAKFDHSALANLSMHDDNTASPMKTYVYNQSVIMGNVNFSSSPTEIPEGLVYLDQNSKIHGKINSGKIILWDSSDF